MFASGVGWDIRLVGLHALADSQDYTLAVRPFCPFLTPLRVTHVGLTWEGSPVVSQHSYGGLSSGLPVSSRRKHKPFKVEAFRAGTLRFPGESPTLKGRFELCAST